MEETGFYTGCVKWFSITKGFGFITDTTSKKEYFVHISGIPITQYKYLQQGEYVEFQLSAAENTAAYEFQATNVRGIHGGKLMCQTKHDARSTVEGSGGGGDGEQKPTPRRNHYSAKPQRQDGGWREIVKRPVKKA